MSSTAYGKTINNQSQINKNLFEDEGILSFIKSFDNSNSAIIDLVIKKDNDNLSSNQYIKGSQSFLKFQTIYLRLMMIKLQSILKIHLKKN